MFYASGLTYGEMNPDEDEFLEVERIPLEKAVQMVLDNEITDAKTQTAVLKVAEKRRRNLL
ncbi:MAG: ADP-ribose pyrophosphatase, partial [Oscillospiraceae bacterium]|nr:ADP-ribose pyrophosphatase [Oscillospiraceae bacterium]